MTMVPSSWRERAPHDSRHTCDGQRVVDHAMVPKHGRAAGAALILWTCVMISLAWATFLVLLVRMR
jgi:hypothetical protein